MKSIKEVQEKLHQEIENYILFLKLQQERSAGLAREKEMSVADVDVEGLSAADKAQVVREFVRSGTMKSFFGQKYTAERFSGLESELADILNRSVKRDEKQHKHSEVIWLRENEMARETYADYMLRGEDYTLFAKAGLHQRSYRLWTEGDNYMKVYYEHLKDLGLNSFLPHNDRRFSTIHSSYLSQHPEMYKYLIPRPPPGKQSDGGGDGVCICFQPENRRGQCPCSGDTSRNYPVVWRSCRRDAGT